MIYKTLRRKQKIEQHEPTKNRSEFRCSGRVSSSCFTSGPRRLTVVTNPVISHECAKDRIVNITNGTCTNASVAICSTDIP